MYIYVYVYLFYIVTSTVPPFYVLHVYISFIYFASMLKLAVFTPSLDVKYSSGM